MPSSGEIAIPVTAVTAPAIGATGDLSFVGAGVEPVAAHSGKAMTDIRKARAMAGANRFISKYDEKERTPLGPIPDTLHPEINGKYYLGGLGCVLEIKGSSVRVK